MDNGRRNAGGFTPEEGHEGHNIFVSNSRWK
ncbi:uncharacterized protein G2W53_018125 [Senna tora]|uniref:Uncharacterized protein n=1 Tax=Senna tora TaxID=362788 RepID=A0A834TU91_9FABA|nr:uncharacterized protein G2W53_018125 [Senna tora]